MPRHRRPRSHTGPVIGAAVLALLVSAVALRPAPVADPSILSVRDECQQALGYPARTDADVAWLRQCVSALTPPTVEPSPTPSPTVQPTTPQPPSSTPSPTPPPPVGGWPGPDNTGVPAIVTLTPYTGPSTITVAGTVVDGKTFGCLTVRAANVVIRNSRQTCPSHPVGGLILAGTNTVVQDSEITGGVGNGGCVTGTNYLLRRVEVRGCLDGVWMMSNTVVVDSWIHDLATCPTCHDDGIQTTGAVGLTIRHNRIDLHLTQTGCIKLGAEQAPLRDVVVDGNLLNGGGISLYAGGSGPNVSGIHIVGNRWLRSPVGYFPNGGYFAPAGYFEAKAGSEWVGNAWEDNGTAVLP